jgi:competence protein ComEC
MRSGIICFVIGMALLQQQSALLSASILLLSVVFALSVLLICAVFPSFFQSVFLAKLRVGLRLLAFVVLGFAWADWRAAQALAEQLPRVWEQRDVSVVGTVDSLPQMVEQGVRFQFVVEQVLPDAGGEIAPIPRKLALSWFAATYVIAPDIRPGQRWRLMLRLKRPHGNANPHGFDYEAWLLGQGVRATGSVRMEKGGTSSNVKLNDFVWTVGNVIERARASLRDRIHAALPDAEYAGVIVALVVGDQREIAQSDWKIFNRTGVGHLVSISGLHITMVAGMVAALVNFLWRRSFYLGNVFGRGLPWSVRLPAQKAAALAGALMALIYVALAGFGVPAQRTFIMLSVVALAMWSGRMTGVSYVLCLALGLVCLFDPWAVLSPGFWLSFGAVAMILFVVSGRVQLPPAQHWREGLLRGITEAGRAQYAVTLGLVPLTLLLFGQVSIVSPIANALAIPLVSFVVTPLALIGSVLPAPLAAWLLQCAHACVAGLAWALSYLSSLPHAVWSAPLPAWWMFGLAMLGTLWMLAPRGVPLRWLGVVCWLPLIVQQPTRPPSGEMWVTALDVGQGSALLIETAQHRLLYDTGPYYSPESDGASRVILPYLSARGITHVDQVMISHNDADHSGGALSLFAALQVDRVSSSLALDSPIVQAAPQHERCMAGQQWEWDGVQFELLHPIAASYDSTKWKPNARSCTLKITNGNHSVLLPGDIEAIQEDELVNSIPSKLRADVLLAPHHGSGTSSTLPFLNAVQPSLAIFQVGYLNRYRHPKAEVFQRYADLGIERLRSDESGAIQVRLGRTITISEYRKEHARYWYRQ